jgi:hypothetical protein
MDPKDETIVVSPDELKADEEIQKEVTEDELRGKVAEEFGLNPDTDVEMLDKLVEREKSHHEKLSAAIKQKINWRNKATSKNPDDGKGNNPKNETPEVGKLVQSEVSRILEERDLESLELSDDLKAEVKDLAKLKGISVREAAKLPYILSRKEEIEREEKIKNATPKRSAQGGYVPSIDPSKPLNPSDFDLNTEEGRKAWNEAKAAREKYRSSK